MQIEWYTDNYFARVPVLVDDDMRIVPEVREYVNYIKDVKKLSPNTVESYTWSIKAFYEWLIAEDRHYWQVKTSHIPRFMRFVDTRGGSPVAARTMNRTLAALSSFYTFHEVIGGALTENPIKKVSGKRDPASGRSFLHHAVKGKTIDVHYFKRRVRKSKGTKRIFFEQVEILYDCLGDSESHLVSKRQLAYRNQLMFRILYETGMRVGELLHMRVTDYDQPLPNKKSGLLYLIEREEPDPDRQLKTGERNIVVSMDLLIEIEQYVLEYRPYLDKVEYLFVSHEGQFKGQPLSRTQVERILNNASEGTGIRCTPHTLRHTHISNLTDAGFDIPYIQARVGHKSVQTTLDYTHISLESQTSAYHTYLAVREGTKLK